MSDFEKSINASDLIEWIMCAFPDWCVGGVREIVDHIEEMPSAQPEIIRCKDCRRYQCVAWFGEDEIKVCTRLFPPPGRKPDDFCSYAERIEE